MKRLLIDSSSILMGCLFAARNGENAYVVDEEVIMHHIDGYDIFLSSLEKTLADLSMVPMQIVLVKDGKGSRKLRREFLETYKARPPKPKEFLEEFNKLEAMAEETLWSYGALSAVKDGFEADDLLAAFAEKMDHVIWSKDGDLLAAGDWFFNGETNPDKFCGIAKKHIVVYKSLVGDTSDKIPGAKGFGEVAFIDMVAKFGDSACDDILDMLEEEALDELSELAEDFKPFKKILANLPTVYASYKCAKFYHPGWDLDIQARFPETNGDLPEWNRTESLIDRENIDLDRLEILAKQNKLGFSGFDVETWEDEESLDWGWENKSKQSPGPKLDAYGSHLAGFSLTLGSNNQHAYYFPVDHKDSNNFTLEEVEEILNALLYAGTETLCHNAAFELPIVRSHCELEFDRGYLPNVVDTMLEKQYVNENTENGLKYCSKTYLKYRQVSYETVTTDDSEILCDADGNGVRVIKKFKMNELPAEHVTSYGADDAVVTCPLHSMFRFIMDYEGTSIAFDLCERSSAYLFAESFLNGIRFDLNRLAELTRINERKTAEVRADIDAYLISIPGWPGCAFVPLKDLKGKEIKRGYAMLTGEEPFKSNKRLLKALASLLDEELDMPEYADVLLSEDLGAVNRYIEDQFSPSPKLNLGSPNQKADLLYAFLNFPIRMRGKVSDIMRKKGRKLGNPKSDEASIRLAIIEDATEEQKEFLLDVLTATELQTEQSLYLRPYPKMPNPKDGMVHAGTGQSGATTRRNTPNGPNVGQVSKKSPIREAYDAYDECMVWVSLDWAGQELRGTAWRSKCPDMMACYPWDGPAKDVHSVTAVKIAELAGIEIVYEEFMKARKDENHPFHKEIKKYRNPAKAVNFGDIFGQTEHGLALKLLITEEVAAKIFAAKAEAFPGVAQWKKDMRNESIRLGYADTMLGARKHLLLDGSWKDEGVLRSSTNFRIQSSAAEQMKVTASKFWDRRVFDRYDAVFHFPVHDEMNFSVTEDDASGCIRECHEIMTEPYADMDLPVESSIEIGPNFGQLKELDTVFNEEQVMKRVREVLREKRR